MARLLTKKTRLATRYEQHQTDQAALSAIIDSKLQASTKLVKLPSFHTGSPDTKEELAVLKKDYAKSVKQVTHCQHVALLPTNMRSHEGGSDTSCHLLLHCSWTRSKRSSKATDVTMKLSGSTTAALPAHGAQSAQSAPATLPVLVCLTWRLEPWRPHCCRAKAATAPSARTVKCAVALVVTPSLVEPTRCQLLPCPRCQATPPLTTASPNGDRTLAPPPLARPASSSPLSPPSRPALSIAVACLWGRHRQACSLLRLLPTLSQHQGLAAALDCQLQRQHALLVPSACPLRLEA